MLELGQGGQETWGHSQLHLPHLQPVLPVTAEQGFGDPVAC